MTDREELAKYLMSGLLEGILDERLTVPQVRECMKLIAERCDIPELMPQDIPNRQNNTFVFCSMGGHA